MFTAIKIAALLGTTLSSGSTTGLEAGEAGAISVGARPAFVLGAGDALGERIRANDVILARMGQTDPVRHVAVDADR